MLGLTLFGGDKNQDQRGGNLMPKKGPRGKLAETLWLIEGDPTDITLFFNPDKHTDRADEACLLVHMYGQKTHTFRTIPITVWYDWPGNIRIHYTDASSISFEGITSTVEGGVYDFYENPPLDWGDVLDRIVSHMSFVDMCRKRLDRTLHWANKVSDALSRYEPPDVIERIWGIHNPNHRGHIIDV